MSKWHSRRVSSGLGSSRPSLSPRLPAFVTHINHPTSAAAASSVIVSTLRFFSCRLHHHHPSHSEELSSSSPAHNYRGDRRRNFSSTSSPYFCIVLSFIFCVLQAVFVFLLCALSLPIGSPSVNYFDHLNGVFLNTHGKWTLVTFSKAIQVEAICCSSLYLPSRLSGVRCAYFLSWQRESAPEGTIETGREKASVSPVTLGFKSLLYC